MNVCRSWFDAKRQIDDAVSLCADVKVIKSNALTCDDKRPLQKTVDGAIPENFETRGQRSSLIFLYISPPKEAIFSDHLLWSVYIAVI